MLTRRHFLITGSSALSALAVAAPLAAATVDITGPRVAGWASPSRRADLPEGVAVTPLSGDRLRDLQTISRVLREAPAQELLFALDAADEVMLDIALSQTSGAYQFSAGQNGIYSFRLAPAVAGV